MSTARFEARVVLVFVTLVAGFLASNAAHAQRTPEAVDAGRLARAIALHAHEPGVDAVVRAALSVHRFDPERTREAAERARLGGLLPQARLEIRRGQVLDLSALSGTTGDRNTWSSGDQLSLGAQLTFPLDRLLFAPEEPALLRELRNLEERRLELVTQVVTLYFERRRLQLEQDLSGVSVLPDALRMAATEALLDVLTDGYFSDALARAESRRPLEAPTESQAD